MSRSYRHSDVETFARANRDAFRRIERRQREADRFELECRAERETGLTYVLASE